MLKMVQFVYWIYCLNDIFTSRTVHHYIGGNSVFRLGHCVGVGLPSVARRMYAARRIDHPGETCVKRKGKDELGGDEHVTLKCL